MLLNKAEAFGPLISFHFGFLGLHFLSFWLFGPWFPSFVFFWIPFLVLQMANFGKGKIAKFKGKIATSGQILAGWPFGPSFPFILAFWAFISFHFGILSLHFLSFWPFGPSFPFILAFWAFISFHFGLLSLHFLSFWPFGPSFPFILVFWASFPFIGFLSTLFGSAGGKFWKRKNCKI